MKSHTHLLLGCLIFFLVWCFSSCSKEGPTAPLPLPPPPSTAGSWSGTLTTSSVSGPFTLSLSQDVIQFSGSGYLGNLSVSISGENHYPNVTFTFYSSGYQPASFAGQFTTPTKMTGFVNGSGFRDATARFTKD